MKTTFFALAASFATFVTASPGAPVSASQLETRNENPEYIWGPAGLLLQDPSGKHHETISFNGFRDKTGSQVLTAKGKDFGPARQESFYLHAHNVWHNGHTFTANAYIESAEFRGRCLRARTFDKDNRGHTTHFMSAPCRWDFNDRRQSFFIQGKADQPGHDWHNIEVFFAGDPDHKERGNPDYNYELTTDHLTLRTGFNVPASKATVFFDTELPYDLGESDECDE